MRRGERLQPQLLAFSVVQGQGGIVVRDNLPDAGGDRRQQLPDIELSDQGARDFEQHSFLRPLPLREVARHLGKAAQASGAVP